MGIVFKNNAKTTLSSGVNNSTTTIPVTEGSVFPAVDLSGSGTFFLMTLDDDTNNEIVKVTTCSGNSGNIDLTVVRAQESTTARAFSSGIKAELRFTSGTIDHIRSDNTVNTNIFTTANSSTTAFTLSQAVTDENDLVVFIDGVFQAHNTYTVSGTTLTLATAPASGRVVTAYSIKGLRSATNVAIATMTGDNSDTTLTLPIEPINENSVQVFFDGVYQNKSNFSISGTTLTFSTAPPTNVAVEAIMFTQTNIDTAAILKDADGDTLVQVEESSDEDTIRMDIAGTEVLTLTNSAMTLKGTTPTLTIGDAGAEDTKIVFDGNAQDYYVGLDDSADDLIIGLGSTVGTTPAISIDESRTVMISQYLTLKTTDDAANQWYLYTNTDDTFQLNYNGSGNAEVVVDTSGLVGIGTTSPDRKLHLNEAASSTSNFIHLTTADTGTTGSNGFLVGIGSDGAAELWNYEAQPISFATSSTERMRIDSSGNVGIGVTSIVREPLQVHRASTSDVQIHMTNSATGTTASDGMTIFANSTTSGFWQRESSNMLFATFGTERMRIDSSGTLIVNRTDKPNVGEAVAVSREGVAIAAGTDSGEYRLMYGNNSSNMILYFSNGSNQAQLSSAGAWVDASDVAYKKDIVDINYGLDTVKKLKPRAYKMKTDDEQQIGFIAQELELDIPEVVGGEDGNKGVSYGQLTAVLTKAIQEQQTIIEDLKARIETLEG